jgi:PTH1 family peptidyl-tRNA hydrolase
MKIVFAQGNPGKQYERTRHNTGFILLDAFADMHNASWKPNDKFKAQVAELTLQSEKVLLAKPQSFYNETGPVARRILDFYKLSAEDFLVIHDELSLPFGTIRRREKGSDAGNNGIKSLNAHIGESYRRLRIGIWNEKRDLMDDADFVLSGFSQEEAKKLTDDLTPHAIEAIESFVTSSFESTSSTL